MPLTIGRGHEEADILTQHLGFGIAKHQLSPRAERQDVAARIDYDHRIGHGVDQRMKNIRATEWVQRGRADGRWVFRHFMYQVPICWGNNNILWAARTIASSSRLPNPLGYPWNETEFDAQNSAAQELTLWEGTTIMDSWRVIVGKPSSPTPVFSVDVSGVMLNPWWNIPSSIAAKGIAAFVRQNPTAARAQGYIYNNGRYRQMSGDNNTLGRMKLVMPNRFAVILHDTSNRELFTLKERTQPWLRAGRQGATVCGNLAVS